MRIALISIVLLVLFSVVIPSVSSAALVPCDGTNCQACDLVSLAQNVITWLIGIMVLVIALIFAIGGLKMVVSRGDSGSVSSARSMMTNAVVGLLILLSAWLIINTILTRLMGGNVPVWSQIQCVEGPPVVDACAEAENPEQCRCEAGGGTWNMTDGTCEGAETACNIPPLAPITDPLAQRMEGGQTVIWDNTDPALRACVNRFIGRVGGSVTSAYRPQSYQQHLAEIRDRWCSQGLRTNQETSCSTLKEEIGREVSKHFGANWDCGAVASNNSTHSSGRGVDITGIVHGSVPVVSAAGQSCLTWRNYSGDPFHYDLQSGCTCN